MSGARSGSTDPPSSQYQTLIDTDEVEPNKQPPKDNVCTQYLYTTLKMQFHGAYLIVLLLGVGLLFPWNAFISAPDYWQYIYGEDTNVLFWFSVIYNWPNVVALVILVTVGHRISFRTRIIFGFTLNAVALLYVPILDNSSVSPDVTIYLTYLGVGLCGMNE